MYKVDKEFSLNNETSEIRFYNSSNVLVSTFIHNHVSSSFDVSDRPASVTLPIKSFESWVKEARRWFKETKEYFKMEEPPVNGFVFEYEIKKLSGGNVTFLGEIVGEGFSGSYDNVLGNVTLNPRIALEGLAPTEFNVFLEVHGLFINAIKDRIPQQFSW